MNDYMVRVVARHENLRGLACITTRLVQEACRRHDAYPTATVALGRALTGGAMMGAIIDRIFHEIPVNALEKRALAFRCSCSRERLEQALISMGRAELTRLIENRETVALTCEFCRKPYTFAADAIQGLIDGLSEA